MEVEKLKREKISFVLGVVLVIIVFIAICVLFVLNSKNEKQITDLKNQINELKTFIGYEGSEDVDFVASDLSSITDKISSMEIEIQNNESSNSITTTDENTINQVNDILKNAEKLEDFYDNYSIDVDMYNKPIMTIQTSDGKTCSITPYDEFKANDSETMNLFEVYYLDNGDWAMYKTDTKLEELFNKLYNDNK